MSDEKKIESPEPPRTELERIYDEQISPLMAQIIAIAKQHKLPMFATFDLGEDPECDYLPLYCTTCLPERADGEGSPNIIKCLRVTRDSWDAVSRQDILLATITKN